MSQHWPFGQVPASPAHGEEQCRVLKSKVIYFNKMTKNKTEKKNFLSLIFIALLIALAVAVWKWNEPKVSSPSQSDFQEESVEEIGLAFSHPKDLIYRKEIADNEGQVRTAGFFLSKGPENNPEYQMYGLYEQYKDATQTDLNRLKTEMEPSSIKEATISGYAGIEGLILGPKTRYVIIILKGNKLFSVSTMPPTQENKETTDSIIQTFRFN